MKEPQEYHTTDNPTLQKANEADAVYGKMPRTSRKPLRNVARQEMDSCLSLEEFGCHLSNLISNTHDPKTGNVELAEVTPKRRSLAEIRRRSVTLDELYDSLQTMVDDYYGGKA